MSALHLVALEFLRGQALDDDLALKIPNLDAIVRGGAEPVSVGAEYEGVDDLAGVEGVQALPLVEVPEHGGPVLPPGGAERSVGGDAHGVEVPGVPDEVVTELAVREGPDLHEAVPAAGHDEGHRLGRAESDAGHPLGVTLAVGPDGVLALAEGVPKLDGLVATAADDLAVVDAESHAEHVLGVSDEPPGGAAGVDLPQAQSAVPRSGERELPVGRDDDVADEVGVAAQGALGVAVGVVLAGTGVGEAPDHHGLVAGAREDEVRILRGGRDGGDPIAMAAEGAAQD